MAIIVGSVAVEVVPSTQGFSAKLKAALQPVADAVGRSVGQTIGDRISDAMPSAGTKAGTKFADTFKAKVDAALAKLPDASVDLDDDEAQAKLEELRTRLRGLSASVGVDIDPTEAYAALESIKVELDELGARSPKIDVQVDIARASAELAVLQTEVDALSGESGGAGAGGGFAGLAESIGSAAEGFPVLVTAGLTIGTALIPLVVVLGTAIASLLGPLTAVAAGLGAFGAVAIPAITAATGALTKLHAAQKAYDVATTAAQRATALKNEAAATEGLSSTELTLVSVLQTLEDAWKKVAAAAAPAVGAVIVAGLNAILPLIKDLGPLINAISPALVKIADGMAKAFASPAFTKFLNFLVAEAPVALGLLSSIGGKLATIFGNVVQALTPLGNDVLAHLADGLGKLATSTTNLDANPKFQKFIDYVITNGPQVLAFMENFLKDVVGLGVALAPLGTAMLEFLNPILRLIAAHPEAVVTALGAAFTGLAVILLIFTEANPIGLLITGIALLAAVVLKYFPQIKAAIVGAFNDVLGFFETWGPLALAVLAPFLGIPLLVYQHFSQIKGFLSTAFHDAVGAVEGGIGDILSFVGSLPHKIVAALAAEAGLYESAGEAIIRGVVSGLSNVGHLIGDKLESLGESAYHKVLGFFGIKSPSKLMADTVGVPIVQGIVAGIESQRGTLAASLGGIASPSSLSSSFSLSAQASLSGVSLAPLALAPGAVQGGDGAALGQQNALLAQQNRYLAVIAGNTGKTGAQLGAALEGVAFGEYNKTRGGR